jgi:hypothetical protein
VRCEMRSRSISAAIEKAIAMILLWMLWSKRQAPLTKSMLILFCVATERISIHSSILRPRRDSSLTMIASFGCNEPSTSANFRFRQETFPEIFSSTKRTLPRS